MKNIILGLILFMPSLFFGQNQFPIFKFSTVQFTVPESIAMLQNDSLNLVGEEFVYSLKGQKFDMNAGEGHIQTLAEGFNGSTNKRTPWKTLTELLAAYQSNDFNKVQSLYTADSQAAINAMLPTQSDINNYMNHASTISAIDVYCAHKLDGRIIAYAKIPEYDGVMSFYFKKKGKKYYMSSVVDSSAVSWNISMHCFFEPDALVAPQILSTPDSLIATMDTLGGTQTIPENFDFQMNNPESYLTLFVNDNQGNRYVLIRVKDGSNHDSNAQSGELSFQLNALQLPEGDLQLFAVESNYPIDLVSQDMINNSVGFNTNVSITYD